MKITSFVMSHVNDVEEKGLVEAPLLVLQIKVLLH